MSGHLVRGQLLLQQGRTDLAEPELRLAVAENPDGGLEHALLAMCLRDRKDLEGALIEAEAAVGLAPDTAYVYYTLSCVLHSLDRLKDAGEAAREAIRLEPDDADYHAQLAVVLSRQERWTEALAAAEAGLENDPTHDGCVNIRAFALVRLGRREDASLATEGALARDPENAFTHANHGWTLLHQGRNKEALEHFREALRLDPTLEFARSGIIEALKARWWPYAVLLRFFLWMSRRSESAQWGVIIGLWLGARVLSSVGRSRPALAPYVQVLLIIYFTFVLATWIASPLFNLVLRLDRFGRHALSRVEVRQANWVGLFVAGGLASLGLWAAGQVGLVPGGFGEIARDLGLLLALFFGMCLPSVARAAGEGEGWPAWVSRIYALGLVGLGGTALGLMVAAPFASDPEASGALSVTLFTAFMWGAVLSTWILSALVRRGRR